MKSLFLAMIFCVLPCWAFDIDDYISKLYQPLPEGVLALESQSYDELVYQREISPWLNDLELRLSRSGLASLNASFLVLIDEQGRITNLELDDTKVTTGELRDFIAKLASLKFAPKPAVLTDTRLLLDAKTLVVSRNEKLEAHPDALMADLNKFTVPYGLDITKQDLASEVKHSYQATLISPEFFSEPRVGDAISFELESQKYIGRVIETGREIIIATDALVVANEQRADTLQYWRLEQHSNSGTWDSMFSGATSAGLGLGLASQGVVTGIFAGLAALGSRMQDLDISLDAGDKFYLKSLGGVEICKQ